jgi:hypothetical protein
MSRRTGITVALLVFMVAGIMVLLFREAAEGPTFRAGDFESYQACIDGIPAEWVRGSLEYIGAESSCHYLHRVPRQGGGAR